MTDQPAPASFEVFMKDFVPGEDPTPDQLAGFSSLKDIDYNKQESLSYIPFATSMQASLDSGSLVVRVNASYLGNEELPEQIFDEPQLAEGVPGKTGDDEEGSYTGTTSESGFQGRRSSHVQKKDPGQEYDGQSASQTAVAQDSRSMKHEQGVDLSIYDAFVNSEGHLASKADLDLAQVEKTKTKYDKEKDCRTSYVRTAWHRIVVPIEVKTKDQPLPFTSNVPKGGAVNSNNIGGEVIKGHMTKYLAKIMICQHRTHIFSIYIHGPIVYLMRWDRAGAVVCRPFSLEDESHKLHRFLYRLTKMTRSQLGYDETVKLATQEEEQMFRAFTPNNIYHQTCMDEALGSRWPLYTVTLPGFGLNSPAEVHLVIGKPQFFSRSIVGRATRGYVAFDLDKKRLVFLKDYWRPGRVGGHTELEVYDRLIKNCVPYIATPLGGGDVISDAEVHRTKAHLFIKGGDPLVHYRFAVLQVGRPIENYATPREMVTVLRQALLAHQAAWEKADVLHRDISCGNILIDVDPPNPKIGKNGRPLPQGFLNDWDMCKYREELDESPTHGSRTGTWVFMSSLLTNFPKKPHQVSDDLESFVYVLFWLVIRFQASWPDPQDARNMVYVYEEATRTSDGYDIGGTTKLANMRDGMPGFHLRFVKSKTLVSLIESLCRMCERHHASLDWEKDLKPYTSVDKAESLAVMYGGPTGDEAGGAELAMESEDNEEEGEEEEGEEEEGVNEGSSDDDDVKKKEGIPKPTMNNHKKIRRLFSKALNHTGGWRGIDNKKLSQDVLRHLLPPSSALTLPGGSGTVPKRSLSKDESADKDKDGGDQPTKGVKRQRMSGSSAVRRELQSAPEEN